MENKQPQNNVWEFWIDVGGTFTDCLARSPDKVLLRHKTLSSGVVKGTVGAGSSAKRIIDPRRAEDPARFWIGWTFTLIDPVGRPLASSQVSGFDPTTQRFVLDKVLSAAPQTGDRYELTSQLEAPLLAIRYLLRLPLGERLPAISVRLGTTRGTNALLTRGGGRTALITTQGFGDILKIGYQARPHLFDLEIQKPAPLYDEVLEINERLNSVGEISVKIQPDQVRQQLKQLRERGTVAVAICLLNAYSNSIHEQQIAQIARELDFAEISVSSQLAPLIKLVSRGDTTVVNAYLNTVLKKYVQGIAKHLDNAPLALQMMTSNGGLVRGDQFEGKDSILSGPAGGVVGFARVAEAAGFQRAIGFDMGGTSTDVARYDGSFQHEYETEKAGVRIVSPMLAIETVAAGGGSICHFDGVKLAVGPASAGAEPGPACYGRGGPLTITDVNLHLGKVQPDQFPFALDAQAVRTRLEELSNDIRDKLGQVMTTTELADGFLRIANANMAQAIRSISIAQGYDPRDYVLVSFGGAAPQHACAVAKELGMREIINHPDAGILSALGIGHADLTRHAAQGVYLDVSQLNGHILNDTLNKLTQQTEQSLLEEGVSEKNIKTIQSLDLRYQGTDSPLTIPRPTDGDYRTAFTHLHQKRYGYAQPERNLEIVAARVESTGQIRAKLPKSDSVEPRVAPPTEVREMSFDGQSVSASCYHRSALKAGARIAGPAVIHESMSTTIIDPGWEAEVLSQRELVIRQQTQTQADSYSTDCDPIMLEIFNRHFAGIAEQMGITLRNTSSSVNVKERLDFSCAIFTDSGDLVVNAPHIPVHLGAMSETVKCVLEDHPDLSPGDVMITNDPYRGGSHLPDVTVVTPVHDSTDGQLRFLVASRAHHAEIGGITPGSMPPFSHSLAEEGVCIRSFKLIDAGQSRLEELAEQLTSATYPTRDLESNLADIRAQIAANQQGVRDLQQLIGRFSWPVVHAYMQHIQIAAETKLRHALKAIPNGEYEFADHLDNGAPIHVKIIVNNDQARIDFRGSAPSTRDNLNANLAIVSAATMYCLRCLINEDIPLNQGVLNPIELIVEPGILNPQAGATAKDSPAVAGGNVETSQRVVDVILGAFGLAAASQGTMNNLLFGNESFGYYETICGGAGATPTAPGADAVHTHMTNTRLTDPEVIERNYPIRIVRFEIRKGSGGAGKHCGGNGVLRELEFLQELQVSILSQRRGPYAPYGFAGGAAGQVGRNRIIRWGQPEQELPWRAQFSVKSGDRLIIETPGGGGFGTQTTAD